MVDGRLNIQRQVDRVKTKINCAHASGHRLRVGATGLPSGVVKWGCDFLDEVVCARDKRVLRVIAVAALGEVN